MVIHKSEDQIELYRSQATTNRNAKTFHFIVKKPVTETNLELCQNVNPELNLAFFMCWLLL